jgi:ferric-dicitrate binding protein FerR (iron transport regulator)
MEHKNRFSDPLDEAIDAVRFEAPAEDEVAASRARVWARVSESVETEEIQQHADIRGCADFRALFPAYRAGKVTAGRELLIQDHLRECGACRKEYESGARPSVLAWVQPQAGRRTATPLHRRFALAASLAVGIAVGAWLLRDSFLPTGQGPRATLASVQGQAYVLTAQGQRLMKPGESISEKEWIRTASGSKAMVQLVDGSRVEMNERTELGVSRSRSDTKVFLERGAVIVEAAKRRQGHLIVHTEDTDVYVTGTVFSVNRGVLGSRVSVAEGSVAVRNRRAGDRSLQAGDQFVGSRFVAAQPVEEDFAWSTNATHHLALLNEFAKLKNQWQRMQLPELRYDSALLRQMPAGTVFFAGLPNLGGTLDSAWRIFETQVQQSPVLKAWWTENQQTRKGEDIGELVNRIKIFCGYLGNEVVFAGMKDGAGRTQHAFLAEVTKSGLEDFIKSQIPAGETPPPYAVVNNTVVIGTTAAARDAWVQWAANRADQGFTASGLGQRALASYRQGTEILVAIDTEGAQSAAKAPAASGLDNVRYFVVEHRTLQQRNDLDSEVKAAVTFSGQRHGLASLLAPPAAAGSLDYFSPNAALAVSMVAVRPEQVLDEMIKLAGPDASLLREIEEVERRTGMSVRNDIAQSLGEDASFGVDGSLLPVPAWKAVVEVRDANRLQLFMERLVAEINAELVKAGRKGLTQTKENWDGRTLYSIQSQDQPAGVQYVFADGYWILGPDKNALVRALRSKTQNWRLTNSWEFRERLPQAPSPHYSGLVYVNFTGVADLIGDAAGAAVPGEKVEAFRTLAANIKPALICLYGEPDAIQLQTRTGLLGLTMDQWLGAAGIRDLLSTSPMKVLNTAQTKETAMRREQHRSGFRIGKR